MRVNKILLIGLLCLLLLGTMSGLSQAEQRDIYIGDLIKLQIAGDVAPEQIKEKFSEFEIVDLENQEEGYQLTVRTFAPGEKVVQLEDKKIKIEVKSTLDKYKERQKVFAGDLKVQEPDFKWQWSYLLYVLGALVIIIASYYIWQWWKNRAQEEVTPYQFFQQRVTAAAEAEDYFVALTYALKRYLEQTFNFRIIGKTSTEIIAEVEDISALEEHLAALEDWLQQVDYYKYTTAEADGEEQEKLAAELKKIVGEIEEQTADNNRDA